MEQMPNIFSRESNEWPDDVWKAEWDLMVRTWMPTKGQLAQLSDIEIECMAVCWPLLVSGTHEEFILSMRRKAMAGLEHGRRQGWWKDFSRDPDPPAQLISFDQWQDQTMAHVVAHLGWFPSVSQARKNGWDRPVERGVFKVGKTRIVEIS